VADGQIILLQGEAQPRFHQHARSLEATRIFVQIKYGFDSVAFLSNGFTLDAKKV